MLRVIIQHVHYEIALYVYKLTWIERSSKGDALLPILDKARHIRNHHWYKYFQL